MSIELPLIESCDDCGACCQLTPVPPFEPGEEIAKDIPAEFLQAVQDRIDAEQQFEPRPCVWYDSSTARCRHYELRPDACRRFEIGSDLCRLSRWDIGLP